MCQSIIEARCRFYFLPLTVSRHNSSHLKASLSTQVNQAFSTGPAQDSPWPGPKRCTNVTIGTLPERTAVSTAKEVSCQGGQVTGDCRTQHLQMVPRVNTFSSWLRLSHRKQGTLQRGIPSMHMLDRESLCVGEVCSRAWSIPHPGAAALSQLGRTKFKRQRGLKRCSSPRCQGRRTSARMLSACFSRARG